MGSLAAPILASTIPAFYSTGSGIVLTIPFSVSRAVSPAQIKGFSIKIKSLQSGSVLLAQEIKPSELELNNSIKERKIIVNLTNNPAIRVGSFYKIQVAFIGGEFNQVGYYSSVAVAKCTSKPQLNIYTLNDSILNSHIYRYEGIYECEDITERPYSYCFELYQGDKLISTSGDLLHNSDNDDKNNLQQARDEHTFTQDLTSGLTYKIKYIVTTNNGLTVSSPLYRLTQKPSISPEINASVIATLNYNNGYVDVKLVSNSDPSDPQIASGSFIVSRACEDTNYTIWDEIHRFELKAQVPTLSLCKDFTIEQGKNYKYAIQQYSDLLVSNRLTSETVYADFEDAFLYDGKRQLKIKYNPKVSSFKKDLLETKTDTIGGKYPFIFRNGRVYYSEFSISGLISYQMDEENLFLSEAEYGLVEKTTNLTGDNIAAEREFKMKVLEWLTNGEPKIFRSPAEGNFIVRLMNSALSPNDMVGRMLHTFTSTAYEIADFNYTTLGDMGFITIDANLIETMLWETVEFMGKEIGINLLSHYASTLRLDNMVPGNIVEVEFENSDSQSIKIGITGSYYIDTKTNITSLKLKQPSYGSMTYSYSTTREPKFNTIRSIFVQECPAHQFVGEHDIVQEITHVKNDSGEYVQNPKIELVDTYYIIVDKRPVERIVLQPEEDINTIKKQLNDPERLYEIGTKEFDEFAGSMSGYPKETFKRICYYDGYQDIDYRDDFMIYEPYVKINGEIISVDDTHHHEFLRPEHITELKSGNGCMVTIAYQACIVDYNIEQEARSTNLSKDHYLSNLKNAMQEYEDAQEDLKNANNNEKSTDEAIAACREKVDTAYTKYILSLIEAQREQRELRGEII